jgi:phage-related protein
MMYGFQYLGQRAEAISPLLLVDSRDIGMPSKNKITASVPFSNETYDFSEIYGDQTYSDRKNKYVIHILDIDNLDPVTMHQLKTEVINWLMNSHGRQPLYDDVLPDYHFMAEVADAATLADSFETGELTVTFVCDPLMVANKAEGDDVWDTFNFMSDVAQYVSFTVHGTLQTTLINSSVTSAYPTITVTADAQLTVQIGNVSYQITAGTTTEVQIPVGANTVTITGDGTIGFDWHREVI